MEYARRYFNEHYNEQISIEDYAQSRNMSVSWFQRSFKQIVNYSPTIPYYLLSLIYYLKAGCRYERGQYHLE